MQTEIPASNMEVAHTGLFSLAVTALRLTTKTIKQPRERTITLEEVSWHDNEKDCWVVIYDRVFDITTFLEEVSLLRINSIIS